MLYIDKEGFFVDLIKKNIHMNKLKSKCNTQLTLDDDFNVPDIKPDIDRIIKEQGVIILSEVKPMNGKLMIKGELKFNLLYISSEDSRPIHNIVGRLPFDEVVNMEDSATGINVNVRCELEDLNATLINSRKISVKSILGFSCLAEEIYDQEAAVDVDNERDCYYQKKRLNVTQIAINKKDTYRIKDEIILPSGKPNVYEVLYSDLEMRNVETRLGENKISIKGDIIAFILYASDDEEQPIQYYESELPFSGVLECNGCNDNMVSDISIMLLSKSIETKEDSDGEERVIDLEVVLDLDVKAYEEEEINILSDLYSTSKKVLPDFEEVSFDNLLVKNNSKLRIVDHIMIEPTMPKVLQICNATGAVKVDEMQIVPYGIQVDGVIDMQILYISEEDDKPLGCVKGAIPFSQVVEAKNINANCSYDVKPYIDQLSVMMLDGTDIEVKAAINLDTIIFDKMNQYVIRDIATEDIDMNEMQALPSIMGYVVQPGDTLWNIAKRFYCTTDSIMEMNDLESNLVMPGDKLVLLKRVDVMQS